MLTNKQQRFVDEYMKDLNATQATIRAGYSTKDAHNQAARLSANVGIQEEIKKQQKKLAEQSEVTQNTIIQELLKIARFDIGQYVTYETIKVIDGYDKDGDPIIGYCQVIDLKDSKHVNTSLIAEIRNSRGTVSIKAYDKLKALELLGKYLGLFEGPEIQKVIEQLQTEINGLKQTIKESEKK